MKIKTVLTLFMAAAALVACPVACVNDPTEDDSTMPCSSDSTEDADCTVVDTDNGDTGTAV